MQELIKPNAVNWFEIPVNDMQRAIIFYEKMLNIKLHFNDLGNFQMAWFPSEADAAGSTGSLIKAESNTPSYLGSMIYFSVEDIEEALKLIEDGGGKIINPKMNIGQHGFVAHFEDSEGNRVALHSVR